MGKHSQGGAVSFARRARLAAIAIAALAPAAVAQMPSGCQPAHYDVIVQGYVGVPASVDVSCGGSDVSVNIQWPFDPPEDWHNVYSWSSVDQSLTITVGRSAPITLVFVANEAGTPPRLIGGCPAMYGGTGQPVAWYDPCIQKVIHRTYADFWILKHVVLAGNQGAAQVVNAMKQFIPDGERDEDVTGPVGAPPPREDGGPKEGDTDPTKPPGMVHPPFGPSDLGEFPILRPPWLTPNAPWPFGPNENDAEGEDAFKQGTTEPPR